jgi:hypothetical protein
MRWHAKDVTAGAALAVAFLLAGPAAQAAGPAVSQDGLIISRVAHGFRVLEVIRLAAPLSAPLTLPLFQPATDATVVAGARHSRILADSVSMPAGATFVTVRYELPLPSQEPGRVFQRRWPVVTEAQEILAETGVQIPIILNQQLYGRKPITVSGHRYKTYVTVEPLEGTERLNLQEGAGAAPSGAVGGSAPAPDLVAGAAYAAPLAAFLALWGWRRMRPSHAGTGRPAGSS